MKIYEFLGMKIKKYILWLLTVNSRPNYQKSKILALFIVTVLELKRLLKLLKEKEGDEITHEGQENVQNVA